MLIGHSLIYVAAKLLPGAIGMLTTALLTRQLPPGQYGTYGIALIIMSFGATLAFEWLGLAYLRLARVHPDPAVAIGTFNRLFATLLASAVLIALIALGIVPAPDRGIVAAGFAMMASYAWFEFRTRFHVASLAPGAYLRMNVARAAFILVAAGSAAHLTHNPVATALATALATFAAAYVGAGATGHGFDAPLARAALRFGLPLAASLALNGATGSLTRALVGALGGIGALGLYTAASALVQNTLMVLSSGLSSAGFSLAVNALEAGDPAAARVQLAANGTLLLAILAPASLGMALTASSLAATLVGPAFRDAVASMTPWLAAAAFLTGLRSHYLDHAFHLGRRMRGQVWVTATAAIITLGIGAALIPRWGPLGAAMAVTAGAAVAVIHAAIAGRTAFPIPLPLAAAARIAAACAVMTVAVLAIPGVGLAPLAEKITAGLAAYAISAIALNIIGLRAAILGRFT